MPLRNTRRSVVLAALGLPILGLLFRPGIFEFTWLLTPSGSSSDETSKDRCWYEGAWHSVRLAGAARSFSCSSLRRLGELGLLGGDEEWALPSRLRRAPIVLTGASSNHMEEAASGVASSQQRFGPEARIRFFDLGLSRAERQRVRSWCRVRLEQAVFPFHRFPARVATLNEYRWKPVSVAEGLRGAEAVWWTDTSIRWRNDSNLQQLYDEVLAGRAFPVQALGATGHSVFSATQPAMYHFLGGAEGASRHQMMEANFLLLVRSPGTRELLKWWVLCALEPDCMAPAGAKLGCEFDQGPRNFSVYYNCHRYDQSALNLLLGRLSSLTYSSPAGSRIHEVKREDHQPRPNIC